MIEADFRPVFVPKPQQIRRDHLSTFYSKRRPAETSAYLDLDGPRFPAVMETLEVWADPPKLTPAVPFSVSAVQ